MISFTVYGIAAPQGSHRGFVVKQKGTGKLRAVVTQDNAKTKPWRQDVALRARQVMEGAPVLEGPLAMEVFFRLPRPKAHYRGGDPARGLRADAPFHVGKKPDASKLLRALEDALTGIVYRDDAQLADIRVHKVYCDDNPRVEVLIRTPDGV